MKRILSALIVAAMIIAMLPVVYAAQSEVIASGTDVTASAATPVVHTWTAPANGTLTVDMGATSPGWRFVISDSAGNTVGLPKSGKTAKTIEFELIGGETYTFTATGWNMSTYAEVSANISYTLTFTPAEDSGSTETEKTEYAISETVLALGDNTLTLLDTAYTTIFTYEPTETGVFTFTAPEGAILGYWGAGSWFLSNPNSTENTHTWTCTGVGQTAFIGVSGVTGEFTLTVEKTGNYEVVETPIIPYENKAALSAFALPEGSKLGGYIDVAAETVHTAVLGEDGYYHFNSADGDIILVDLDYMDIVLSDALKSDRPVMYAYVEDENGQTVKYDIGDAVLEYETVMDGNGYYPLTEDLIFFYDVYGNGAGIYTFHVTTSYNPDNVWMYCMRTVTFPDVTEPEVTEPEPTEPEPTEPEPTEPEPTEPEPTELEPTEPEPTEPEPTEPEPTVPAETVPGTIACGTNVAASGEEPVVFTWTAPADGTLQVTMGAATPGWRFVISNAAQETVGLPKTGSSAMSVDFELIAGTTYTFTATGWDSDLQDAVAAEITYTLVFTEDTTGGEIQKEPYKVSDTKLTVGSNSLTLIDTAITTIYPFKPTETGTYTFTAPEGAHLGYWGSGSWYLTDPNSTVNTYTWTCTSVGQGAYIGVSNTDSVFTMTVLKHDPTEPEPTEPEPTEPEPTEPEPTEPETSAPEITEPETSVPQPSEPGISAPAGTVFAVILGEQIDYYTAGSALASTASNAASGSKIVLFQDVDLSASKITVSSTLTLDLNGYTLTSKINSSAPIVVTGTLTIEDSSADHSGTVKNTSTSSSYGVLVDNTSAVLTVNGGNITAGTQGIRVYNGTLYCNGGNISATNYGIYISGTSAATITDGVISCASGTFYNPVFAGGGAVTSITGGYFSGSAISGSGLNGSVAGGYFTASPKAAYIADGCLVEETAGAEYPFKVYDPNAQPEEPEPPVPEKLVDRWNIALDNDLVVNFYLNVTDENAKVQVSVGDDTVTYPASELVKANDGKYILNVHIAAAQMNDNITVQIVGSDAEGSYTVRQYADTILANNELSDYHPLIKEMLNYGAAAQNHFGHNTENPANKDITGLASISIPEAVPAIGHSGYSGQIAFYGASLVCRDKIAIRFYFTGDATDCHFTANGSSCTVNKDGDLYYVEFADILPQNLDQSIALSVTDADGDRFTVTYSPMHYIVRMNKTGSDSLKTLLSALYNYHLAAKELR